MTNNNSLNQTDEICLNFYSEYHEHVENFGLHQLDRYQRRLYKRGKDLIDSVV